MPPWKDVTNMSNSRLIDALTELGADTGGALRRFMNNEAFYEKFLLKFREDKTFDGIAPALAAGDTEAAFMAAHTLKGIAGNLGFTALYESVCALVEFLRAGDLDGARGAYAPAEAAYRAVMELLEEGAPS